MWKWVISLAFIVLILVAGFELYGVYNAYVEARENYSGLKERADSLKKENQQLEAEVGYLSIPENLLKTLRERFNYKFPGEQSIIVVPKEAE
jgi:cell division protein FtsB